MILPLHRPPSLETPRLRLDPLRPSDATHVYPMMRDPEVMAFWDVGEIDDPDIVVRIVAAQVEKMDDGAALYWGLRTLADGSFLGTCDLSEIDRWRHRAEDGFMLGRAA